MTEPRLAASVEASALMRRATADGGFATVLAKGDAERGALILIVTERGRHIAVLERMLDATGTYGWHISGPAEARDLTVDAWLGKRRRSDSDLWLIELDVPDAERFIAEMTQRG